jgi:hypothetical protein
MGVTKRLTLLGNSRKEITHLTHTDLTIDNHTTGGHVMPVQIDYKGRKYNALTLLAYVKPGGQGIGAVWLAKCDCGNTRQVSARAVVAGRIKSCGKCPLGLGIRSEGISRAARLKGIERRLYVRYLKEALSQKAEFDLTPSQFLNMTKEPCQLCGTNQALLSNSYNLIHRLDRKKGYTLDNLCTCCPTCSPHLGRTNVADALENMRKIIAYVFPDK